MKWRDIAGVRGFFAAIGNGRQLAQDRLAIHEKWTDAITARRTASVWNVLPMLLSHPAVASALI